MRKAHSPAVLVMYLLGIGVVDDVIAVRSGISQLGLLHEAAAGKEIDEKGRHGTDLLVIAWSGRPAGDSPR